MGRECGQALLNALFVPNVSKHFREDGELGSVQSGNVESGLAHEGEKSHCFQGHCLAPGVGAGDHQKVKIFPQVNVYGHHFLPVQKGMASFPDMDVQVAVEDGLGGVHLQGQLCLGEDKVQKGHELLVVRQFLRVLPGLGAEGCKDFLDLFFFFQLQLSQLVVQVDDGGRFDEESGSSGGLVVDHAVYLSLVLCFDRDAVAVVAHGDYGVLKVGAAGSTEHIGELAVDPVVGLNHGSADGLQSGAGVVCDLVPGENTAVDLVGELCQGGECFKVFLQGVFWQIFSLPSAVSLDTGNIVQQGGNVQQLFNGQGAADLQGFDAYAHIPVAAKGSAAAAEKAAQGVGGLGLVSADLFYVRGGFQLPAQFFPGLGIGLCRKQFNDFIVLQGV